jgi:hypothetical protein
MIGGSKMGTRADFYVGRGTDAKWIGSIAWDGNPEGIADSVLKATSEGEFVTNVGKFFAPRDDATQPEEGWPWPWDDSNTTDYAYAFDAGQVWASSFGRAWFDPKAEKPEFEAERGKVFPNMKAIQNVRFDEGSGVMVF